MDDFSPYFLQMAMFITTIKEQGSKEQQEYWLPLINNWEIYGAYAQTELGHGSNVKGLELQARYDPSRRQFIFHSPTLTASKWWNGSMGRTATHAIVVAQLMLPRQAQKGQQVKNNLPSNHAGQDSSYSSNTQSGPVGQSDQEDYVSLGPHPFIVQIRNQKTHLPLDGIVVGDIGPKYGYAPMDNGYMLFENHHVSHSAFLSRYFSVDADTGAYTSKAQNPAVVYGSLTNVRVNIVMHARLVLARAVTVAMRYLTIRRQFRDRDLQDVSGPEMTVLDYPTVQIRVMPLLAQTYALHYTGLAMGEQYAATRSGIEQGDFGALSDLHATSSGLKSLCTSFAADGIEICRRALGGHGFHSGSGLIQLNNDYLSKPTVEGDNHMITQQTASYMLKKTQSIVEGKADQSAGPGDQFTSCMKDYLSSRATSAGSARLKILGSDKDIVRAFERRTAHLSYQVYELRIKQKRSWNSLLIQLHHLSNAFSQLLLVRNFYNALFEPDQQTASVPESAHPVLSLCFQLFSLHTLNNFALDFIASNAVPTETIGLLPDVILHLMAELRPHVVPLVDAWCIPDYLLDSALGRYDGKVYEDLFDRAHRQNPLNLETFNPYYQDEEIVMGRKQSGKEILAKL